MSTVLSATGLMNRLQFKQKFGLIFLIFLIPVLYIFINSFSNYQHRMAILEKEQNGLAYINALRPLYEKMAKTRGMTNAYLNGKTEFKTKIEAERAAVANDLSQFMQVDALFGQSFNLGTEASNINKDWHDLMQKAFNLDVQKAFMAHTEIINRVLSLSNLVHARSGLILDAQTDSHYLMNSVSVRMPLLIETMGKARGFGSGVAAKDGMSDRDALKLSGFIQTIIDNYQAVQHSYSEVYAFNPELQSMLSSLSSKAYEQVEEFINVTKSQILEPDDISIDAAGYFKLGTETISALLELNNTTITAIEEILLSRKNEAQWQLGVTSVVAVTILFLTIYLFAGFFNSLMVSITRIKNTVGQIANGDLTVRVKLETRDEVQSIAHDLNLMVEKNHALVTQVINAAEQVVMSSNESVSIADNTRDGVNQQRMEIEQIATAMNEMTASVFEVAKNADSAALTTRDTDSKSNDGHRIVSKAVQSINELSEEMNRAGEAINQLENDSNNIGSVLEVIQGIAEQTNLLALNAAIEAARAGEQGRGFAVVADEVRTLASRTQASTEEIHAMIERLQSNAKRAVTIMEQGNEKTSVSAELTAEASAVFTSINDAVKHISQMSEQIATAANQQSSVSEEINRSIVNVQDVAIQTSEGANQSTLSSKELINVVDMLQKLIREFKIS